MTLIVRRIGPAADADLGAAGVCRVSLCEVIGCWGAGKLIRVVILGGAS